MHSIKFYLILIKILNIYTLSIGIYRIIGNNIPLIHKSFQNSQNLNFIITHENNFEKGYKKWIINHIINKTEENNLFKILTNNKKDTLHIPFNCNEYYKKSCTMEEKKYFITNVNQARNIALKDGLNNGHDWILPLDGNCFITKKNWKKILMFTIKNKNANIPAIIIPMYRIYEKEKIFQIDFNNSISAEPQIMLHKNSNLTFNESLNFRYGYNDKIDILTRAHKKCKLITSKECPSIASIYRLPSGLNITGARDWKIRNNLRNFGILSMIDFVEKKQCKNYYY